MDNIFYQLALVLVLACGIGFFVLKLKLPLVVAYLITGIILSVLRLFDLGHSPVFEILPEIGIAFVLFLIGMELKLNELKALGKPILISGLGQIVITSFFGYVIARVLGFENTESFYLGLGLAFSSTVVVIKMLIESRDLSSLYGKLSIGMLLVEDLVAVAVLILISIGSSSSGTGIQTITPFLVMLLKVVGLFFLTFFLSKHILNKIFEYTSHSTELLYITSITWCFAFTSLAVYLGFSVEIGSFLAGIALASSPYHLQIQAKIKPMRDFFLALFFIYLGSTVNFHELRFSLPLILSFTAYALMIKPFVYMYFLSQFGFRKHTLYQTSFNLTHVSEFSLIVLLVGVNAGLIAPVAVSVMATVAVISITMSSILTPFSKEIYKLITPIAVLLEKKGKLHLKENKSERSLSNHIVIIGAHRVGAPIIQYLHQNNIPFVAMDFNPTIVRELTEQGIHAVYGDIEDPEIIDALQIETARLVICTASELSNNELLFGLVKERNKDAKLVLRATDSEHARKLKLMGADYVILPEKVSGDYIVQQIKHYWPDVHFKDGINISGKAISTII